MDQRSTKVRRILQLEGRAATLRARYESTLVRVMPARHKAELMGVKPEHIYIDDLREEFVADYVFPMMRANALYEGLYLLGTPGISGVPMPQGCPGNPIGGAVCPSADENNAVEQWITECATDTPSLP